MPINRANSPQQIATVPEEITGQPRRMVAGGVVWRRTFAALRHRNFRLFFFGQLVSLIGTWMQNTAQGWLVYQLTGSKMLLGVVAAAGSLPMLLFGIWGGSVADRYPKRPVMLVTQTVMMVLAFVLAALVAGGWVRPWQIVLLAACGGVAMAFDMPARQSFMVEMASRDDLMNAIALNSSIVNGARVVGPAVAGVLMATTGLAMCFCLNGLSFIAVIAGLLLMRLPARPPAQHRGPAWQHALEGLRYVWCNRRVRILLALMAAVGIFGWSYAVLMPAFARDVLGVGENRYGVLLGAAGLGALLGALTVATFGGSVRPRWVVLGGVGWFSAMLLLLSVTRIYWLCLVWLAAGGMGMMLFFSTTNTLIQTSVPDEMRGRVMGVWALVFGGMTPVGGLEAGALAHWLGVPAAIGIGAVVCALAALVTWLVVRHNPPAPHPGLAGVS